MRRMLSMMIAIFVVQGDGKKVDFIVHDDRLDKR